MDLHTAARLRIGSRQRRGEGHRPGDDILFGGQHRLETGVDPIDDFRPRTEIHRQAQRFQFQVADPALPGPQVKPHLGLTEKVDRLHRVADQEQRASVAVFPASRQPFQQGHLVKRSILKLVYEEVADTQAIVVCISVVCISVVCISFAGGWITVAGCGGRHIRPQPFQGSQGHLGEIDPSPFGEDPAQFRHGQGQQMEQRLDDGPLRIGVARVGQEAQAVQVLPQFLVAAQRFDQSLCPPLHLRAEPLFGGVGGIGGSR